MRKDLLLKKASKLPPPTLSSLSEDSNLESFEETPIDFEEKFPSWDQYFDQSFQVEITHDPETTESQNRGGLFQVYSYGNQESSIWYFFLHGGGYTSLSWAHLIKLLPKEMFCVAFDFPGHGKTNAVDEKDLSASRLVEDTSSLICSIIPENTKVVLVGHSLGGAIAVRVAKQKEIEKILCGLMVIDVVEGTAINSLPHMLSLLSKRPSSFSSLTSAIDWAIRTNTVRNRSSAEISIPSQLVKDPQTIKYKWRTDLVSSEPFWKGWFEGLSDQFLSVRVPKELVLAGTDRLDTPLTIGQMQGKFKLSVLSAVGHVIQEDSPESVAQTLIKFRNLFRL